MFYLHREIPELLKLMPPELWLVVQRIMFETNRYTLLKSGVIRKALTNNFFLFDDPQPYRYLYLPHHCPNCTDQRHYYGLQRHSHDHTDHHHYYLINLSQPTNDVAMLHAKNGKTTRLK